MVKFLLALARERLVGGIVERFGGEAAALLAGVQWRIRYMVAAIASLIIAAMATLGALLLSLITFVLNPGGTATQRLLIADAVLIALTLVFGIAAVLLFQRVRRR